MISESIKNVMVSCYDVVNAVKTEKTKEKDAIRELHRYSHRIPRLFMGCFGQCAGDNSPPFFFYIQEHVGS